ncbi:hypothetical protein [uncultured Gammaproteobacteria bacterium]|nr:hypothetical protein [uncultured Gammaproteobacteria bacterium]CAC9584237.1 hypothetical protein [uncultured Gammaproteobacteria bacterium]
MFNLHKHHIDILSIMPLPQYSKSEIQSLIKEAENDNPIAQYNLSTLYYLGHCVKENHGMSYKWLEDSAKLGDSEAQFTLGDDANSDQDYKQAFYWFSKAADQEHTDSMSRLGDMYFNGNYVDKDEKKGFYLFTKSMHRYCSHEQDSLGYCYQKGIGTEQNDKDAIRWYQRSVDQNNASAKNHLGIMYILGTGITKDQEKGFKLISESAEQYDLEGLCSLGLLYAKGIYVEQDYQKAKKYLEEADDYGDYSGLEQYDKIMEKVNSALKNQRGKS